MGSARKQLSPAHFLPQGPLAPSQHGGCGDHQAVIRLKALPARPAAGSSAVRLWAGLFGGLFCGVGHQHNHSLCYACRPHCSHGPRVCSCWDVGLVFTLLISFVT